MTDSSEIERLRAANRAYADTFTDGDLSAPPRRGIAILTCMDARMHVERILGLEPGDAHVIRNAGGRVTEDALRSLVVSSLLLGTREFLVIHHTGCGMQTHTNEMIRQAVQVQTRGDASHIDFLPFTDLEASVRDDVRLLLESPLLPDGVTVRGFIYDVRTGQIVPVDMPTGRLKSIYSE
jgi:carbonic anhydrase